MKSFFFGSSFCRLVKCAIDIGHILEFDRDIEFSEFSGAKSEFAPFDAPSFDSVGLKVSEPGIDRIDQI